MAEASGEVASWKNIGDKDVRARESEELQRVAPSLLSVTKSVSELC